MIVECHTCREVVALHNLQTWNERHCVLAPDLFADAVIRHGRCTTCRAHNGGDEQGAWT